MRPDQPQPCGNEPDDAELLAATVSGTLKAHQQLFERHSEGAWAFALVSYRRIAPAEVALRLAFGMAIVAAHGDPAFADLRFDVVLRSKVRSVAKRVAKASAAADDDLTTWARAVIGPGRAPNRLIEVFDEMGDPARATLWLNAVQHYSLPAIATIMDLPLAEAALVLERARAHLSRGIRGVPSSERPSDPVAAMAALVSPMPPDLGDRVAYDWQRWLEHTRQENRDADPRA